MFPRPAPPQKGTPDFAPHQGLYCLSLHCPMSLLRAITLGMAWGNFSRRRCSMLLRVKVEPELDLLVTRHGDVALRGGDDGGLAAGALAVPRLEIHRDDQLLALDLEIHVLHDVLALSFAALFVRCVQPPFDCRCSMGTSNRSRY